MKMTNMYLPPVTFPRYHLIHFLFCQQQLLTRVLFPLVPQTSKASPYKIILWHCGVSDGNTTKKALT